MRTFLAIAPDPALRDALHRCARELARRPRQGMRWIAPRNYHLTLVFLGEIPRHGVEAILATLRRVTPHHVPFRYRVEGVGLFPSQRRPHVVAARIAPDDGLMILQHELRAALETSGLVSERRSFRPHITLARIAKQGSAVGQRWNMQDAEAIGGEFTASAVTVYESQLASAGANYRSLATLTLGSA